jgi:hypothetical protein
VPDIEFHGQTFALEDHFSDFALSEFAAAAAEDVDSETMEGAAAVFNLLEACIVPKDWARFRKHARRHGSTEELLPIIAEVFKLHAGRPTSPSTDSSDGRGATELSSEVSVDDRALDLLAGRPDLQLMVMESRKTA